MTNDAGASGAPRFDVVLRGYDRRQVDEHVARMQRIIGRMRADLELARSQPLPIVPAPAAGINTASQPGPQAQQPTRPRPSPRPRPRGAGEPPDVVGSFTDRMQSILQAAEDEAAEVRRKAHTVATAETRAARAEVAELARQRDVMIGELSRMRGQLESLLSAPTARMTPVVRPAPVAETEQPPATGPQPAAPVPAEGSTNGARNGASSPTVADAEVQATQVVPAVAAEPESAPPPKAPEADLFQPATGSDGAAHRDVEATVQVSAVRPGAEDTVIGPPVLPEPTNGNGADAVKDSPKRKRSSSSSRSG